MTQLAGDRFGPLQPLGYAAARRFGPGDGIFIAAGPEHGHKAMVLTDVLRVVLVEDA